MAEVTFKGGAKLKAALQEMEKRSANARNLGVGFMSGSTYPDGTPVAMVAAIQNYGAPGASIPKRPFFSSMVKTKSPGWGDALGNALKSTHYDAHDSLAKMGNDIGGELRNSIIETTSPPLSPITLMLRKMYGNHPEEITGAAVGEAARRVAEGKTGASGTQAKPLVWTGHMLDSVEFAIDGQIHKLDK